MAIVQWFWDWPRRVVTSLTICAVLLSLCNRVKVEGHGRLLDPPSRASMWRFGFNTNANYDDNQGYCGGREQLWNRFGGRCGVCGDAWEPRPRAHERGGRYFDGTPTRHYVEGEAITVVMGITANHRGWVEFRVCPYDWPSPEDVEYDEDGNFVEVSHACLDKHLLQLTDGSGTRFYLPEPYGVGEYSVQVQLPRGVSCQKCLFQWKWNVANSWGTDPDGESCVGCGKQEQFYACADIVIDPLEGEAPDYPVDYPDVEPTPAMPPAHLPPARPQPRYPPQEPEVPELPPRQPPVVPPWDLPDHGRGDNPNNGGSRGKGGDSVPSGRKAATKRPATTTSTALITTTTLTTTTTTPPSTTTTTRPTTSTVTSTTTSTASPTTTRTTQIPTEKPRKGKPTWNKSVPSFWKWLLYNHPVKQPPQTSVVITKPTETSGTPTRSWWQKLMALAEQRHGWGELSGAELGRMELAGTPAPTPTSAPSPSMITAGTTPRKASLTTPAARASVSSRTESTASSSANVSWSSAEDALPWWVHTAIKDSGPAFLFHGWEQAGSSQESEQLPEVVAGDKNEVNVVAYTGLLGPSHVQPLSLDTRVVSSLHVDKHQAERGVPRSHAEQRSSHVRPDVQPYRSLQAVDRLSETLPPASVSENSEGKSRDLNWHEDQGFRAASPDLSGAQNDFISPRQPKKETQETGFSLEQISNELQGPVQNLPSEDNDFLPMEKNYPFHAKDLICSPVGEWAQYAQMWRWCHFHCRGGYCPATHCICA